MKKLTASVFCLALLLFVCSTPAVYAQAQNCNNDQQCDDGQFCNGLEVCVWSENEQASVCIAGSRPCEASETCVEATDECILPAACELDADCADDLFCNGEEICDDGECVSGIDPCETGETCDEDNAECIAPECELDDDCADGEICTRNMCVDASGCRLTIRPKKVRINTMFRPASRRLRIKGGQGFDPYAAIDFGPIDVKAASVNKKGVLKVHITIPASARVSRGSVRVSVGDCVGEVLLK